MKPWLARMLAVSVLAVACAAHAQSLPVEGRDYQELGTPRPVSTGQRIEVIEFFYYGCPVCYEAQPHIARWLMRAGPDVALLRVPAVFTESSESFARTFYTLGAMNQIARLHWPVYDNHHFDGRQLNEEKNVVAWVASNGVDAGRFAELWKSEEVKAQIAAAKQALETYDIKGVPSFVVDGKYVTSARMAGGVKEAIRVLEHLVQRAAGERKK
ncbi:MAG TPA: thiol:disulfide interchange protein DsbA/DsbL [Burkholderiales bacterium]|nr:thiol:disulfide interchange protein DsbA/DsbL [Burkholderiales bacterium]